MATVQDVRKAGEAYVVELLLERRFTINAWPDQPSGGGDIVATGGKRHVLVQVRTSVLPDHPGSLTRNEATATKARAALCGAEPWQARVTMNADLTLNGTITWRRVR